MHINFPKNSRENVEQKENQENPLMDFRGEWPLEELKSFKNDMKVLTNFITELEEQQLFDEVEPYMKRLRYEYDHWDDAIHGFRETERKHWYPHNREVLNRVSEIGFEGEIMPFIHILDLAPQGVIKPHVDSTRYCGHTIAGLSLLSDAVMRLVRTKSSENSSKDNETDAYRSQPKAILENNFYVDILLPRRSLYIMSHTARYNFTHEILANEESKFQGQPLTKERRISVICRNDP
ncbi:alpha-ketoglutarate-dependent dioxygenase alkB homolog 7, mitochondrial isoform 2-T5 [Cochliomyia hominivorax]